MATKPNPVSAPFQPVLAVLPDEPSAPTRSEAPDSDEFFIRRTFSEQPEAACGLLYRAYYPALCSHVVRLVYSREVAEDIVGEVFLTFWRTRAYQTITTSYRAYLFRAVRNRGLDYLRQEFGRSAFDVDALSHPPAAPAYDQPDQVLQLDELLLLINQTVADLPPQAQRVFVMSRFEGRSGADIAAELQVSPRTVEGHITRALSGLRQALRQHWLPGLGLLMVAALAA
jgi:RNA polymerase sigma-70 factor (ECF subfamily)